MLWIDLEQHVSLTKEKFVEASGAETKFPIHVYTGVPPTVDAIERKAKEIGAVLVVIDSLSRQLQLHDENDASQANRALSPLLDLTRTTGAALVTIHHERKREGVGGRSMRGSSAFLAALDVGIALKVEGDGTDNRRRLELVGRYPGANTSVVVSLGESGYTVLGDPQTVTQDKAVEALGLECLSAEEWAARLKVNRTAVQTRIPKLLRTGLVFRTGSGKKGDAYKYRRGE